MRRLLLSLVLTATASAAFLPGSALAAEYNTFVGCDSFSESPVPSHACVLGDHPAAYFEADEDTEYEVCIQFPNLEFLCSEPAFAEAGLLYQNNFGTELAGQHYVYWYDALTEVEIGFWAVEMQEPPPLLLPLLVVETSPPAPTESAACVKAKQRVRRLKGRLRLASCSCQEAKIRPKLRKARAAVRRLC
jgi:hypothetical protein